MTAVRYALPLLLTLAPVLASAQVGPDSIRVEVAGEQYPGYGAVFGEPFPQPGTNIGPLPLVPVEGTGETGDPEEGCDPLVNADEVAGSIALILRGSCAFVRKVQNAVAAGAEAVVVYNDPSCAGSDTCETLVLMGGDCEPDVCSIPAVFISRNSANGILAEIASGPTEATLIPIRVFVPPTVGVIDTGVVETALFDSGYIGRAPGAEVTPGFTFDGEQGLFIGALVVGRDGAVIGDPYGPMSEFQTLAPVTPVEPPFPAPFGGFDQGFTARLAADALGLEVQASAYARDGDPFVVFDLVLENVSGTDLSGIHAGLFADLDVGDFTQNLGGFDEDVDLVYVYDASGTSASHFGVAALGADEVSGWTLATDGGATEGSLWASLTTAGTPLDGPQDARPVVGVGPFDLAPGATARARFALVAGEGLDAILANAAAAQAAVAVAAESAPSPNATALHPVYPNPLVGEGTVRFALPSAQAATLAVYDVLGRRVAVLAEGVRGAGEHRVSFDAAALPSGVYVVRLEAGGASLARPFTVVR